MVECLRNPWCVVSVGWAGSHNWEQAKGPGEIADGPLYTAGILVRRQPGLRPEQPPVSTPCRPARCCLEAVCVCVCVCVSARALVCAWGQ